MALNEKLRERIQAFSAELRREVYGPQGYPAWGTRFTDIENQTAEVGDAIACEMLSQSLREQAEAVGHHDGRCHCGEPIPLEEIAGRLLQAKRGEANWQESYGHCKRCRKAFFPSLPSLGNRSR